MLCLKCYHSGLCYTPICLIRTILEAAVGETRYSTLARLSLSHSHNTHTHTTCWPPSTLSSAPKRQPALRSTLTYRPQPESRELELSTTPLATLQTLRRHPGRRAGEAAQPLRRCERLRRHRASASRPPACVGPGPQRALRPRAESSPGRAPRGRGSSAAALQLSSTRRTSSSRPRWARRHLAPSLCTVGTVCVSIYSRQRAARTRCTSAKYSRTWAKTSVV